MLMAALNPKAHAVVREGRAGLRPPVGERDRLEALLDARLGAMAPSPPIDAARPLRPWGWRFAPPLAIGVALVGAGLFLALRPAPTDAPAPPTSSAPLVASAPVQAPEPAPVASARPVPEPGSGATIEPPAAVPRAQDRLAQEVALLSRAMSDLRSGRAAESLKLLDEHQRKFPKGILGVERRGARAQAFCALKRVAEGRAELAHLAPQSPAAGRAKQVCDAASAATDGR